jgi:predicted ribosome quality control (RQC) complex YloA/Tae2 family protein
MDFQELSRIIEELSHLVGARVERVHEGVGKELYLTLRRERKNYMLLLSPDRSMPRLHLVSNKPAASASPRGFSLYLRGRATGSRITGVALLNRDRVAELRFSRLGAEEYRLVFELIGAAANMVITDASWKVLAVYYPAPPESAGKRLLVPGLTYELPEQARARAHSAPASAPSDTAVGGGNAFARNRQTELRYERLIDARSAEALRSGLRSLAKKTLTKLEKKVNALTADLAASQRAEEYRQAGEVILANLDKLKAGQERALLTGYDGITREVQLDRRRAPKGNAELYFKKYKKAKAGREIISARLRGSENDAARLNSFLVRIEHAEGCDALGDIRSELVQAGFLRERGEHGKKRITPAPSPFRTIECAGWEILVGRSAAGNDYLSTRIARPNDLWLHAEGLPGSHVLIRNPDSATIPSEVFARAASLAAFYSKGKSAGKVAVTYTLARHVRKPKGAKPGLVTLAERKTVMAMPETG